MRITQTCEQWKMSAGWPMIGVWLEEGKAIMSTLSLLC